jgi:MFS transporter, NNP family, nitrate/nitrite transporter
MLWSIVVVQMTATGAPGHPAHPAPSGWALTASQALTLALPTVTWYAYLRRTSRMGELGI